MAPSESVVSTNGLSKTYGELKAVDGITFDVRRGEVFGLLGPNGAGKTTTIEMLEGLNKPDAGTAEVLGIDVTRQPERLKQRIGVQLQTAALYPNLSVVELVDLFGSFYEHHRPASDVIRELGLDESHKALSKNLSGGQRQRLSIALALVNDPELMFLDEPTTGLDPQARRTLWDQIEELRRQNKTIVLTTHYMEEAEQLCDRVAIMDHGKILEIGTVNELVARHFQERTVRFTARPELPDDLLKSLPGVERVSRETDESILYTLDAAQTVGALLRTGDEFGLHGLDMAVRRPTLEDVFIKLTGRALRD